MVKLKSCPCCGGETMLYRRDGMTIAVKQIIDKFNRRAKPEREEYENGKTEKAGADCKNA